MAFVSRLVLVTFLTLLVALVTVAGAAFFAGSKVGEDIETARVSHLLGTLRSATEANLSIGLTLDQLSLLQSRIEREKVNDPSIVVIDIFSAQGRFIYSTDRGTIGEPVDASWLARLKQDGIWHLEGRRETIFGTRFDGDLGLAGGIAVTVSDSTRVQRLESLGLALATRSSLTIAAACSIGVLAAFACAFAMTRPFARVAGILRGEAIRPRRSWLLEGLAVQTRETWEKADERAETGMRELQELDDAH